MRKRIPIFILAIILMIPVYAAEKESTPNELDSVASKGEIGLTSAEGFKGKENPYMYQRFAIESDIYNYFRVGFIQNKPLLNPSSPPGSLATYQLIDADPDSEQTKNRSFMTDGNKNLWVWHMIKNKVPVRIELTFGLFYRYDTNGQPIKQKPYYAPYMKIYTGEEPPSIVAEGGWKVSGQNAKASVKAPAMGTVNPDGTVTLYVIDEKSVGTNLERNDAHKLVIDAAYVSDNVQAPVLIETYYAKVTLKVVVGK